MDKTPVKSPHETSFEMLSKNRSRLHNRKTLSGVSEFFDKGVHRKSFSSQLSRYSDDLNLELQMIKEEMEARYAEQKQRDAILETILGIDYSVQTEVVQADRTCDVNEEKNRFFLLCKNWVFKCFKFEE